MTWSRIISFKSWFSLHHPRRTRTYTDQYLSWWKEREPEILLGKTLKSTVWVSVDLREPVESRSCKNWDTRVLCSYIYTGLNDALRLSRYETLDPVIQEARTHIQLVLQQSGPTETSSRVKAHICRTPRLRLSMTSSSTYLSLSTSRSVAHTKARSGSRVIPVPVHGGGWFVGWGGPSLLFPRNSSCRCLFSFTQVFTPQEEKQDWPDQSGS